MQCDLLVVGCGATGTSIMAQLAKMKPERAFTAIFIDKSGTFGPGFPYSDQIVLQDHLVNIAAGCIDITKTDVSYSELSDFIQWSNYYYEANDVPPRYVVGEYLKTRFQEFYKQALHNGVQIRLEKSTAVLIERNRSTATITLEDRRKISSSHIALVTGHWQRGRFFTRGYFASPWPAKRLLENIPSCHVAIIGSSLSAIDAALTLATKFGQYQKGNYVKSADFAMTMYSRSGQLPEVMGVVVNKTFTHRYVTGENIKRIVQENDGFLPLKEFFGLWKEEMREQCPMIVKLFPDFDNITVETFFGIVEAMHNQDCASRLKNDIKRAVRSFEEGKPIPIQNITYQSYAVFDEALQYFSAEDLITYLKVLPTLHKVIGPFPLQNARKILALMETGALKIVAIGTGKVSAGSSGKGVRISWREDGVKRVVQHDYAIDALGQSGEVEQNLSPLYQSLRREGFCHDVMVPFRDQQPARSGHCVTVKNGTAYHKAPGLLMDMRNFSLIGKHVGGPTIYAMGPATYGQVAFPQDLSVVTTCAERIVEHIEKELDLGDSISKENRARREEEHREAKARGIKPNAKGFLSANMRDMSRSLSEALRERQLVMQ
jgi:uncharacterized NAD(P)/FAD-binding protein YdhS